MTKQRTAARETIFFAACAEFHCLISLSEAVLSVVRPPVVPLHHNLVVFHE